MLRLLKAVVQSSIAGSTPRLCSLFRKSDRNQSGSQGQLLHLRRIKNNSGRPPVASVKVSRQTQRHFAGRDPRQPDGEWRIGKVLVCCRNKNLSEG